MQENVVPQAAGPQPQLILVPVWLPPIAGEALVQEERIEREMAACFQRALMLVAALYATGMAEYEIMARLHGGAGE